MPPRPGRLGRALTVEESAWAAGLGPLPELPGESAPPRRPVLVPAPARGGRRSPVRVERLWVDDQGALRHRSAAGEQVLASPGELRSAWWLEGSAPPVAGLTPEPGGWLVLRDETAPRTALRLADWCVEPQRLDLQGLERCGVVALVTALGCRLQAVSSTTEASRVVGRVPPDRALRLPGRSLLGPVLLPLALVVLAVVSALLAAADDGRSSWSLLAVPVVAGLLLLVTACSWRARQRHGPAGPWLRPRGGGLVAGAVAPGPLGNEVVLRSRLGEEWWITDAVTLVLLRGPAGVRRGALLLDRDEAVVTALDPRWDEAGALELAERAGWTTCEVDVDGPARTLGRLPRAWWLPCAPFQVVLPCLLGAGLSLHLAPALGWLVLAAAAGLLAARTSRTST